MTNDSMDKIAAAVAKEKDVEASAAKLLKALSDKIAATAGDETKATDLADQINANADALSAAVAANTPAEGATGATGATGAAATLEDAKKSGIFTNSADTSATGDTGQTGQTGATGA